MNTSLTQQKSIVAILQARVSSQRLPQKVLMPILGKPMIARQIERLLQSKKIQKVILATSTDSSDDALEAVAHSLGIDCYRGNLNDVLDRFYQAALLFKPDYLVRLTGDCPLIDPKVVDQTITFCLENHFDYVSNALEPTYPDGLDTEVFRFECLQSAWESAKLKSEREHVTPYLYSHPEKFKIGSFKNDQNFSSLRWTVDEKLDFELITQVYQELYPTNPTFGMEDILELLERRPELKSINVHINRNEGYQKSLEQDAIVRTKG